MPSNTLEYTNSHENNDDDNRLNLTPLIEKGEIKKARELSAVEPELFAGVKSHSAYINVNKTNDWNLFFWYFPAEDVDLTNTPWIIWLQGGPGASSMYGLFNEIGPIHIVNGEAQKMPITWNSNYSLLFIDNPVHTGFSYSTGNQYVHNEDEVGTCLLSLLEQFLQVFPELQTAPLVLAGESYAGKYIPAFGHYIHNRRAGGPVQINLKGLAIGDGWTDPVTLFHYSEFALQIGLLDYDQAAKVHQLEDLAREQWENGEIEKFEETAPQIFQLVFEFAPVPDVYNYIKDDNGDDHDTSHYEEFLNRKDVQTAIHVGSLEFNGTNEDIWDIMQKDIYLTAKPWLEELLEHYAVMCYSGQVDLIVGYALSVHTYRSLNWTGADAYLKAARKPIYNDDHLIIGFIKTAGNFMDVMVRGAGHMVPVDKPAAAKKIIDMFLRQFY